MRVFVAGATGAIGRVLVPLLLEDGHEVRGMTRSQQRAGALRDQGAEAAVADAFDAPAVRAAIVAARPEALIHELTDIPAAIDPRRYERQMAGNDRLRVEGTRNLLDGAREAGVARLVAQSIAFAYAPRDEGLRVEDDPLALDVAGPFARGVRAVADLEAQVKGAGGVVLRYGWFYGPGTSYGADGTTAELVRRRRFPVLGGGAGVWSFIHLDDAARATVAALGSAVPPGAYNVVDDDPAPVREWLPIYAQALGAPPPWRVPAWVGRLAAGRFAVTLMTATEGASNAKARDGLAWAPEYASWREGFRTGL